MTPTTKQYYSFISYKRDDQKWAEWLQEKLEHYKLPTNLNGRSDLPKEIRPVFRDKSELAAGVLADEIQKALDNSKYLIVICSPHSAKSEWVNKEVQAFVESGRTDKIIPFIIEGTPNSGNDETECFPKAIRELPAEDELLGVNINEMGRDAAAVKVVAQMFGLRFDDLWQRHEREKKRKRILMITAGVVAFLAMAGVAFWMYAQRQQTLKANWAMMENRSKMVSEMIRFNAKDDLYLARMLALEILPEDIANPIDKPFTAEAERALRESCKEVSAFIDDTSLYVSQFKYHFDAFYSPNGKQLVYSYDEYGGFSGKHVFVYDAETAKKIYSINDVTTLSYSPEEDYFLYSSYDSTLNICNANTFEVVRTFKMNALVPFASYYPDGKKIIYNSKDSICCVIDAESGEELLTINEKICYFNEYDNAVRFSNDGKNIFISNLKTLNVWNAETGKLLKSFTLDKNHEFSSSFKLSLDGNYLAYNLNCTEDNSLYSDTSVVIVDLRSGKEVNRIYGTFGLPFDFSPDGKTIIASSGGRNPYESNDDCGICFWDMEINEKTKTITTETYPDKIKFSPDGNYIISTHGSCVKIWDAETGRDIKTVNHVSNNALFSPDGKSVLSYSNYNMMINSVNSCDNKILSGIDDPAPNYPIDKYAISTDKKLISYMREGKIRILNTESCVETHVLNEKNENLCPKAFSPDGEEVIYYSFDENVPRCWFFKTTDSVDYFDLKSDDSVKTVKSEFNFRTNFDYREKSKIVSLRFNHDGSKFVSTSFDVNENRVSVWDAKTNTEIMAIMENTPVRMTVFSPDGKQICYIKMTDIKVVDSDTGDEKFLLKGHSSGINHVVYNQDGSLIASVSMDKTIKIWDAFTGKEVKTMVGHSDFVNFIDFSSDGKYVVTASDDKTVRIWDLKSGVNVNVLEGHDDGVMFAIFTPDGKHIISAGKDGTIRQWDFPPLQDLIDQTRERFKNRPLTEEERKMYYLE
ncbi:MAG: TIR domain-containing protein [Bacteroidales bacterium]|nr:TIR domain-containing protein [Bacteroidales bacterium]